MQVPELSFEMGFCCKCNLHSEVFKVLGTCERDQMLGYFLGAMQLRCLQALTSFRGGTHFWVAKGSPDS